MSSLSNFALENLPFLYPTLAFALAWTVVRAIFYGVIRKLWRNPDKDESKHHLQEKVLEEGFAMVGAVAGNVVGYLAYRTVSQDPVRGGCGLTDTSGCFVGWHHDVGPRHPYVALFHNLELGWYLHYLIKSHLGMGMADNLQMHLHHASTISLLLMSFLCNLHRSGTLVLVLLNVTNPFLHMAKVLHYVEAASDKLAFLAFAIVFFLSRIVAYPLVILRATLTQSFVAVPAFLAMPPAGYLPVYVAANSLLLLLMVMQLQWFAGIVRLLRQALAGSSDGFKKEGAAADYAAVKAKGGKAE